MDKSNAVAAVTACGEELETDRSAFAEFYRFELAGQVRRAALMLRSAELANDVVHDAFVAVYERWGRIDQPGPYLNRCVLNGCRAAAEREHRRAASTLTSVPQASPSRDEFVSDLVAGLPFNQRAAVVLRFYVGMTEAEIAATIGCAPGSVGPWINRALHTMRKALQ